MLAAKKRIVVAADLIRRFRLYLGQLLPATVFVDGNEDEIGAGDVQVCPGLRIFDPDFDANFERRIEGAIDAGLENEQIADVNRLNEVDVIHGGGDHVGARVAIGGDGAGEVNEVHEAAAKQVAERVGVVREDDLSHLGLRAGNGAHLRVGFSGTHLFWLAPSLSRLQREFTSSYNESTRELLCRSTRFQFRQSTPITQIALVQKSHYEHNGQDCRTERDS